MEGTILTQFSADELKALIIEAIKETLPKPPEKLYSTFEDANYVGVTTVTLHAWKQSGKIKCLRIGNRLKFEQSELDRLIRGWKGRKK